ncbi:hypothetical protein BY996DRAFT_1250763 [Phakopsora pachyrhizi]|nr:hypothetical protein BY996DRAFT_1250763 [Phakopsora pachyrhizi]
MHKFSIVWLFQALICLRFCSSHQLSKRGDVAHVNNDSGKSKSKGLLGGSESSGGNPGGYGSGGGLPIVGGLTQGLPLVGGLTSGALGGASSAGGLPLIGSLTHGLPLVGSLTNGVLGGAGSTGGLPLVGGLTRGLPLVGDVTNGLLGGGGSGGIPGTPVSDGQNVNQVPGADGDAPWSLPSQAYGQGIECPRGVTAPRGNFHFILSAINFAFEEIFTQTHIYL